MTCTKTEPKNDLFLNCRRKTKELSKKELSNVAPASNLKVKKTLLAQIPILLKNMFENQRTHRLIRQNKTKQNYLFARSVELHVVTHSAF